MGAENRAVTHADLALQGLVLALVIEKAPDPVPVEELAVLLFEGRFTPEDEAETLRAADWLVEARLLERGGGSLKRASPATGLARADERA